MTNEARAILLLTAGIGIAIGLYLADCHFSQPKLEVTPFPVRAAEPTVTPTPDPTPTPTPTPAPLYQGYVSYYSHEGCLGCSENQTMGNGQPFDETKLTLAVPCEDVLAKRVRYNTKVTVTNLDTGKKVQATITDCGGFSRHGRVADLSKGLAETLGAKTDKTTIRIEEAR
jgi:rare lipoprotein A